MIRDMRVVLDTNTVVSGLLWHGYAREVLDKARSGRLRLYTTAPLLDEPGDVLKRPKFARRLAKTDTTAHELVFGYAALALLVTPHVMPPVVTADPDDDAVLACAVSAKADIIISGDSHLLVLDAYRGIPILSSAQVFIRYPELKHP